MRFLVLLLALCACQSSVPPTATCSQQWEAYSNDRMHGAMLGGLIGGSLSGTKPTC